MYFCCAYSPELHQRKEEIQLTILQFFDSVKDKITHENYIIDFYVTTNMDVMVVELNPFHIGAGACLFSWQKDRELFMNGPFTFKIIEEQNPAISESMIPIKWKKMIDAKYITQPPQNQTDQDESCIIL